MDCDRHQCRYQRGEVKIGEVALKGINNKIDWKLKLSISGSKEHSLLYRSKFMQKGIQCEIHTPVKNDFEGYLEFGEQEIYFFIDGDEREFRNEEDLIRAIKESY